MCLMLFRTAPHAVHNTTQLDLEGFTPALDLLHANSTTNPRRLSAPSPAAASCQPGSQHRQPRQRGIQRRRLPTASQPTPRGRAPARHVAIVLRQLQQAAGAANSASTRCWRPHSPQLAG